jgi:enterobactin synthetase component D
LQEKFLLEQEYGGFIQSIDAELILLDEPALSLPLYRICYSVDDYCDRLFHDYGISPIGGHGSISIKRKAEYLAGRIAAKYALDNAGYSSHEVTSGAYRQPLWPKGLIGSISHSDRQAIAAVMPVNHVLYQGIGIDIEAVMAPALADDVKQQILSAEELATVSQIGVSFELALTIVFSAKESLFKAVFNDIQSYMEFSDASLIQLDRNGGFMLILTNAAFSQRVATRRFHGRYFVRNNEIMTVVAY